MYVFEALTGKRIIYLALRERERGVQKRERSKKEQNKANKDKRIKQGGKCMKEKRDRSMYVCMYV